jgi:hypothetical protein
MGEDVDKYMFYKAAVIACDAATALIRRYRRPLRRESGRGERR